MFLHTLPFDCLTEVTKHLNIRGWNYYRTVSKESLNITNTTSLDKLENVISETFGVVKIKNNTYKCHYLGEYSLQSTPDKKIIRHGLGIFTRPTGENTSEIFKGLFNNNQLRSSHEITFKRKQFTYTKGPYVDTTVSSRNKKLVRHKYTPIGKTTHIHTYEFNDKINTFKTNRKLYNNGYIEYYGQWDNNNPNGIGIMTQYNNEFRILTVKGNWLNGKKHGLMEIRGNKYDPCFEKHIIFAYFNNDIQYGVEIKYCKSIIYGKPPKVNVIIKNIDNLLLPFTDSTTVIPHQCNLINILNTSNNKIPTNTINLFEKNNLIRCSCHLCKCISEFKLINKLQ